VTEAEAERPAVVLVACEDGALDVDVVRGARLPPRTAAGRTAWAAALHDRLASRPGPVTAADVAHVASWLQVQAVGSPRLAVVEPRCERFLELWSSAAVAAGLDVLLARRADGRWSVTEVAGAPARHADGAGWRVPGRADAVRTWFADRTESAARLAVRLVQR
jgi:hypothetical protein